MTTSCLNPAAQTFQRLERGDSRVLLREAQLAGHVVRTTSSPRRTAEGFWTVLLRSLSMAAA
jgi:hypothetical protein